MRMYLPSSVCAETWILRFPVCKCDTVGNNRWIGQISRIASIRFVPAIEHEENDSSDDWPPHRMNRTHTIIRHGFATVNKRLHKGLVRGRRKIRLGILEYIMRRYAFLRMHLLKHRFRFSVRNPPI